MVKRFEIRNNTLIPSETPSAPVEVYINPDTAEKSTLARDYQLDEHTLSSAMDPDEVPRVEFDDGRMLLIWKRPKNYSGGDGFYFNVASVGLFLIQDRLIIILTEDIPVPYPGPRQAPRVESTLDVLLNFLYSTVYHYLEHLKVIRMISRDLQEKINTSMENEHLIQMFHLSESLVYYANAINSNNAVLTRLRAYAEKRNLPEQTVGLLDDLIIENDQCFKQAEIYTSVFSGLMDARGTLVNNNMNLLLKNLTIINIVFLPLNLIASILGMSEFSMMTENIDWRIAYGLFIVGMVPLGWLTAFLLGKMSYARGGAAFRGRRKRRSLWGRKRVA